MNLKIFLLSILCICFLFGKTVVSQTDAVVATLLEEILALKDQISALELEVYDLKNTDTCSSCDSYYGDINVGNSTATINKICVI